MVSPMRDLKRLSASLPAARQPLAAGLLSACYFLFLPFATGLASDPASANAQERVRTPASGNAERIAILDALRAAVKDLHDLDVKFVVLQLKVLRDWAFVHTLPQSADGRNKYEDVSALMKRQDGIWRVVDMSAENVETLEKMHPSAPHAIFADF
jgi:hypothetical protein